MEKALFITRNDQFAEWNSEFSRLYYGQEFCERLLPSEKEFLSMLTLVKRNKINFTLVTPFVGEQGLRKVVDLLENLKSELGGLPEIVVNDWGVFAYLHSAGFTNPLVLGRLLVKQKRGPQILKLQGKIPEETLDHFKRASADAPSFTEFLRQNRFTRLELDNLPLGLIREEGDIQASLYYPYAYITTTRLCLFARYGKRHLRAIGPCQRECRDFQLKLTHPDMPLPIIVAGNTQFYEKAELPRNAEELGINRLVYQPEVPAG